MKIKTAVSSRTLIPHLDDVGMCHGSNVAFDELTRDGFLTCGSIMVPCPWFREAVEVAQKLGDKADVGVHLTLTSEWPQYRWRPVSTVSAASGLIDEQGYFWRSCALLRRHVVPEAAEIEMRGQIDHALNAGVDVTHLDAHMGATLLPELLGMYLKIGEAYRLPILLPREIESYLGLLGDAGGFDREPYFRAIRSLNAASVVDHFRTSTGASTEMARESYQAMIEALPSGTTYIALHCNAPGDFESIFPSRAHRRTDEYHIFRGADFGNWAAGRGFAVMGMRPLRETLRGASLVR
jgi:predicted glycoside hydrolase/deacetylase ChbG (UPF0249 family)